MRTIYIVVWMVTVIALASCVKEFDSLPATDDTGTTRITFAIKSDSRQSDNAASPTDPAALTRGLPSYGGMPNSRALSPKEEQQISNVRILVFDAKGLSSPTNISGDLPSVELPNCLPTRVPERTCRYGSSPMSM